MPTWGKAEPDTHTACTPKPVFLNVCLKGDVVLYIFCRFSRSFTSDSKLTRSCGTQLWCRVQAILYSNWDATSEIWRIQTLEARWNCPKGRLLINCFLLFLMFILTFSVVNAYCGFQARYKILVFWDTPWTSQHIWEYGVDHYICFL